MHLEAEYCIKQSQTIVHYPTFQKGLHDTLSCFMFYMLHIDSFFFSIESFVFSKFNSIFNTISCSWEGDA